MRTIAPAVVVSVAAVFAAGLTGVASAQTWPTKPLRIVVPNAPGGGSDTIARLIAERIGPALGQQVLVDNRGGAGGRIAAEHVARAPKDGYTLMLGTGSTLITGPALYPDRNYDPVKDFAPISLAGTTAYVITVHPTLPVKGIRDLIALARRQPDAIAYASTGPGSPAHLGAELLSSMGKFRMVHVPYKGGAPAMLSLLQGETYLMVSNFHTALPPARAGRIRALGVTSPKRTPLAPDLPTVAEQGLPGYEVQQFYSVVAPAGTPADSIARLNSEMQRRFATEDTAKRLSHEGIEVQTSTPAELGKLISEQYEKWSRVIKQAGIKVGG